MQAVDSSALEHVENMILRIDSASSAFSLKRSVNVDGLLLYCTGYIVDLDIIAGDKPYQ